MATRLDPITREPLDIWDVLDDIRTRLERLERHAGEPDFPDAAAALEDEAPRLSRQDARGSTIHEGDEVFYPDGLALRLGTVIGAVAGGLVRIEVPLGVNTATTLDLPVENVVVKRRDA